LNHTHQLSGMRDTLLNVWKDHQKRFHNLSKELRNQYKIRAESHNITSAFMIMYKQAIQNGTVTIYYMLVK